MTKFMNIARNVEVWIFGAFAGLVLVACLDRPVERSARAKPASPVSAVRETGLAQPQAGAAQPMYVVYVVGKRPGGAQKRTARAAAGAG